MCQELEKIEALVREEAIEQVEFEDPGDEDQAAHNERRMRGRNYGDEEDEDEMMEDFSGELSGVGGGGGGGGSRGSRIHGVSQSLFPDGFDVEEEYAASTLRFASPSSEDSFLAYPTSPPSRATGVRF